MNDEEYDKDYGWTVYLSQDGSWSGNASGPHMTIRPNSSITSNSLDASSSPILFMRWLAETKELQEKFYKEGLDKLPQDELEDWMRVNAFAAEDEIHEAMGEISWKTWTTKHFFNREEFIGEVVDALHFIGNMLIAAGCTDGELNAAYVEKMERNRKRQLEGYTGTNKCVVCKRAADDVTAHGGEMINGICGACDIKEKDAPCTKCDLKPSDPKMRGYYFKNWVSNADHPTVHSTGYGCNGCFCDPGDDHK